MDSRSGKQDLHGWNLPSSSSRRGFEDKMSASGELEKGNLHTELDVVVGLPDLPKVLLWVPTFRSWDEVLENAELTTRWTHGHNIDILTLQLAPKFVDPRHGTSIPAGDQVLGGAADVTVPVHKLRDARQGEQLQDLDRLVRDDGHGLAHRDLVHEGFGLRAPTRPY